MVTLEAPTSGLQAGPIGESPQCRRSSYGRSPQTACAADERVLASEGLYGELINAIPHVTHSQWTLAAVVLVGAAASAFPLSSLPRRARPAVKARRRPARARVARPVPRLPSLPFPEAAVVLDTLAGPIRAVPFVKGLANPWSIAFLPNGDMLVTEKPGRLRLVRNGTLEPQPISGVPAVLAQGQGGLLEVSLHPQFATEPVRLPDLLQIR